MVSKHKTNYKLSNYFGSWYKQETSNFSNQECQERSKPPESGGRPQYSLY